MAVGSGMRAASLVGAVLGLLAGAPSTAQEGCDRERGERVFTKCAICHARDAAIASPVGPNLHGVVGRASATLAGFKYSKALREVQQRWTPELLGRFLADPQGFAPGTAMAFTGLKDADDRAAIICLLESSK
ncbi:MAG: c-type cytochrome [Steroidobacteraceae bacterium]